MLRAAAALILAAVPVLADNDWRDRDDWRRGRRDANWGRSSRGNISVVNRTIYDLRAAASRNRVDGHERGHFREALEDLDRFRYRWTRDGRFDEGRLDSAIENIADLARADQIHPSDRRALTRDLYALREFRSMRGGSGWR